ncbi:MAG: hypothetical protein Q3966_01985 [Neisseria sp.]|nr:hypothetical protein [Neisseria sp.]
MEGFRAYGRDDWQGFIRLCARAAGDRKEWKRLLRPFRCRRKALWKKGHDAEGAAGRAMLVCALSLGFTEEDKPLVRWLGRQFFKYQAYADPCDEIALCAYMVFRYFEWRDQCFIYRCKFGTTDTWANVDPEMLFGFGLEESLDFYRGRRRNRREREVFKALKRYRASLAEGAVFRSREDYLAVFEQVWQKPAYHRENLALAFGFSLDDM